MAKITTQPAFTAVSSTSATYPEIELYNIHLEDDIKSQSISTNHPSDSNQVASSRSNGSSVWWQLIFWIRISILIFSILLFILSVMYSVAQLVDTKLAIIQLCPQQRNIEEIWEHSYHSAVSNDGEVIISGRSHWGRGHEACWTTRSIEINTDNIWYSNQYDWEWKKGINGKCILFGVLSLCWIVVVFYGAITLIMDLISICRGTLHTKSRHYQSHKTKKTSNVQDEQATPQKGYVKRFINWYLGIYFKYFVVDTTGFVITKVAAETIEFVVQFVALLKYNGYFRDLAVKPDAVLTFASVLAFNMFGSGMLWSLYTVRPTRCHGLIFKRSLFFVDKVSDVMYTLFPIYLILSDDYNGNTVDVMVLLGQLNLDGWYFITAFAPSLFLCINCFVMSITSRARMKKDYFKEWKKTLDRDTTSSRDYDRNWIHKSNSMIIRISKRMVIGMLSMTFVGVALFSLILTTIHLRSTESHCVSVSETKFMVNASFQNVHLSESEKDTLSTNPELFVFDEHCIYKVYPFTDDEQYRCQCRVFVINWEYDLHSTVDERKQYFNVTLGQMLDGAMSRWFMMEKFETEGIILDEYNGSFNLMKDAVHLKALKVHSIRQTADFEGDLFDRWRELEYLSIRDTLSFAPFPESFGRLKKLRHLQLDTTGADNHFPTICKLTALEVLWFYAEIMIEIMPECMANLVNMRLLAIEVLPALATFPLSLLSLPQLSGFSLSRNVISWDGLLNGNMPSDINRNDTDAVMEWLDEHFIFSNDTEYYLSLNPICYENVSFLTPRITDFITTACEYPVELSQMGLLSTLCGRWLLGDGKCQAQCNDESLLFDMGDCIQSCFAEEISNCTLDKLANDRCDPGCNNRYCIAYDARSIMAQGLELDESTMLTMKDNDGTVYAADRFKCPWNGTLVLSSDSEPDEYPLCSASSTKSTFIDSNIPSASSIECDPSWIGDKICDDSCRVSDCGFDDGDCNIGCADEVCSIIHTVWVFFNEDRHDMNFTYGCDVVYPTILTFFELLDLVNCSVQIRSLDYNGDEMMNFREFAVFGMMAINDFDPGSLTKGSQVNCSFCGDSEFYNVYVGD